MRESCRRENPVRCAVPAGIRKKRYYPETRPKKEQVERAKAMRDQAEKERTEVLERFQAVKGRLESEQSMIVGFLEKEGKTETDFEEKEAENALRKLTEDLKKPPVFVQKCTGSLSEADAGEKPDSGTGRKQKSPS